MSDPVAKKPVKKAAAKKPAEHPKYIEMVAAAITSLKERNGSSRQAIVKYIKANYKVGDSSDTHIKLALKRGVQSGALVQAKGAGASGSFKIGKEKKPDKKPVAAKKKKPAAKKPVAKKPAAKKPAAKKAVKKTAAKKTPKKAAKKPAAKKPAPKKTPAKKAAKKAAAKKKAKKPAKK